MTKTIPSEYLLNTPITCLPFEEQIMLILRWAKVGESRTVCLANVHMLMEAYWNSSFARVLEESDMVTPDGMPLVWMLKRLGIYNQNRVAGLDVFINLCKLAQECHIGVYFVGSQKDILKKVKSRLEVEYPLLQIAGMESLPYVTIEEITKKDVDINLIDRINRSGAKIAFVCLGCPKQEIWMNQYKNKINAVMIGVGAVFSMYAGLNPRAPYWIQVMGLEWFYRLSQEPQRLWGRYRKTIPPFLYLAVQQLIIPYKNEFKRINRTLTHGNQLVNISKLDTSPSKIGEILVRQGFLSQELLNRLLLYQEKKSDLKLGEILVQKDLISVSQLTYYLKNQNIKLGQILVKRKLIRASKIDKIIALKNNENQQKRLGELLVELRLITQDQLIMALLEQYWRRKGWWLNPQSEDYLKLEFENQNNFHESKFTSGASQFCKNKSTKQRENQNH